MTRKLSMDDAAYCAAAWASGERQKDLAARFSLKGSAPICIAIRAFLGAYADIPDRPIHGKARLHPTGDPLRDCGIYGPDRKALVRDALARYRRARG